MALKALKGERTVTELAQRHDVHANQITQWKTQLLKRAPDVFGSPGGPAKAPVDLKTLHAKLGELTLENDILKGALDKAGWLSAKQ